MSAYLYNNSLIICNWFVLAAKIKAVPFSVTWLTSMLDYYRRNSNILLLYLCIDINNGVFPSSVTLFISTFCEIRYSTVYNLSKKTAKWIGFQPPKVAVFNCSGFTYRFLSSESLSYFMYWNINYSISIFFSYFVSYFFSSSEECSLVSETYDNFAPNCTPSLS